MLLELRVENYAVIDNVAVGFGPGLNLLTGETGAGKSILIDALTVLLGEKASSDMIRHGMEKAHLSCVFEPAASARNRIDKILDANGIEPDDQLILKREIHASGKGRVFVNNQPATVALLKQLAPELGSIHAQNETLAGFDARARLDILDHFAGVSTEEIAKAYTRQRDIRTRIAELESGEQDRLRLVDLWSFQSKEITDAKLESGEDERLETEKRVLANAEKLYAAAMGAYESLYDGQPSAVALVRNAERQLAELTKYDLKFGPISQALAQARAAIEDVSAEARDYAERINASPERLAEIEDRLALLDRLKRKYGSTVDEVMNFGEECARKLNEVESRDEILKQLQAELKQASATYLEFARAASKRRFDAAKKLEKLVEAEINDLAMKAHFKIAITGSDDEQSWGPSGIDSVAYLIATNAGEPLKPIEQIASGGELSRVMLALKATVEAAASGVVAGAAQNGRRKAPGQTSQRTLVFDEIDTGIGGRAAEAVGKRLKSLAKGNQVLCITHLPQIASFADQHFVIEKKESGGRTKTSIRALTADERREEIARMLSGAKLTEAALKNAEQMLKANA